MDKNKIAVSVFNKMAKPYQDKFMDVSLYHDSFDLFCASIKKENAEVLELACGPGNITKYLLSKRKDLKILGTDLATNMIDLAKQNNPKAEFQLMDCRNMALLKKRYDAIMCGFCFPYLSKEEVLKLIGDARRLLNPKGMIYISTIEGDYNKSGFKKGSGGDEIYMHYYEAEYLCKVLEECHFKILNLQCKKYKADDGTNITDLILIAEK